MRGLLFAFVAIGLFSISTPSKATAADGDIPSAAALAVSTYVSTAILVDRMGAGAGCARKGPLRSIARIRPGRAVARLRPGKAAGRAAGVLLFRRGLRRG